MYYPFTFTKWPNDLITYSTLPFSLSSQTLLNISRYNWDEGQQYIVYLLNWNQRCNAGADDKEFCSISWFTWGLTLHVHWWLGLAAWGTVWVPLSGGALAMVVPRWISGVVRRVVPSRSRVASPSWRGGSSWRVMSHWGVFRVPLGWPWWPWLIWMTRWGGMATRASMMPVITGRRVSPSVAVLILRPQVLLRRLIVIMIGVFETMPASPRWVAAAVVSRAGTWLLKPVSFFLAQMVGFGNREQITVNLHVVWRQRHAGWEKEEGRRQPHAKEKYRREKKQKEKQKIKIKVLHSCRIYIMSPSHITRQYKLDKTHTLQNCLLKQLFLCFNVF